jgi:reactive intermediate/imine deaminase
MMYIETIYSKTSSAHYSPAVEHNGILYISGQLSINPENGRVPEGGITTETRQALKNLETVLKAAGAERTDVIQCRIYTTDVSYWDDINTLYAEFFGTHKPARAIVPTTGLHYGCLIEIEAIAAVK